MQNKYRLKRDFVTREYHAKERLINGSLLLSLLVTIILLFVTDDKNIVVLVEILVAILLVAVKNRHNQELTKKQIEWVKGLSLSEREAILKNPYTKDVEKNNLIDICRSLEPEKH
ncbi:TPA: hypothetical protein I7D97_003390 [Vibrio cholerae]|nr:hypothetical protein [Vibrio cholerae]HAS5424167.1 hypothetical protein [Vibrio cholerae]